ncbi:MAG TPA: ABC transporter substrate-binding protein [Treponemataceae bacterium]|nr:ABC transporter substrate-binding protein [Treponemataceae bacterium]
MKKTIFALTAIAVLAAGFTGCAKKAPADAAAGKTFKIGISKIVAHPALDLVEKGIQDEVAAQGITASFDLQNANGDVNTATQIATKFLGDNDDLVVAIATPTAVAAANAIKDKPVIFATVTDPVGAGLVDADNMGKGNVTGLSDRIDVLQQITLFKRVAGIKTLGYIYTSSEANSASSLAEVEKACAALGIAFVPQSINNSSEVKQAAEAIIGRVDGIYLTTDNTVFSALPALVQVALSNKKPVFSADTTGAKEGGCLMATGFDYYKAGRATGKIVADVLRGKKPSEIPVKYITEPSETDFLIDLDTAKACGITFPKDVLDAASKIIENGKLTSK